ncbi:uncharacterized protein DUF3823 [Dysgonomonas alginatilytica]|uniref:Uncharacterized protein DUF3823 n=1 Tax=Dysgonomonas alginatilytica TaxID=1605892 RepID=A0A2V3PRC8_9BACT|nr:DUF3823 domain-containing protein [Dysgonomonas alginatilytica]PXV66360.1 uncharacterized protein DUF3823 [Dysgonomonas alginatilytica]
MKKSILFIICICSLVFTGCGYDNYDEPESTLSGKIVYEGNPVGVRTNAVRLDIWQDGYAVKKSFTAYIAHDGTYSVTLFDGQYKVVRRGGAPWEDQPNDTIIVNVKNKAVVDIPVKPYFIIKNESFQKGSGTITAKFTIDKILASANVAEVRLYLGKSILTDQNKNEKAVSATLSTITIGQEATLAAEIPANLVGQDYLFARVGVRSTVSSEFYYTQIQKISLK